MVPDDPWGRARRATEEMESHLSAIARLADERALAVQELLDRGLTRSEVARSLGVTPAVITKILKRPVVGDASTEWAGRPTAADAELVIASYPTTRGPGSHRR